MNSIIEQMLRKDRVQTVLKAATFMTMYSIFPEGQGLIWLIPLPDLYNLAIFFQRVILL